MSSITEKMAEDKMTEAGSDERLFEISILARPDRLKLVRAAVREAGKMCNLLTAEAHDLMIAVDEACQNVIRHGYGGDEGGKIILRAFRTKNGIMVELQDFAPVVDVEKVRPRDLEDVRPGGLGTHFIQTLLDEVRFERPTGGGNLLRMVKHSKKGSA